MLAIPQSTVISNLLCLFYDHCRAPRTGGEVGGEKSAQPTLTAPREAEMNIITIAPNPTQTWATVTYDLIEAPKVGMVVLKDLTGRVVLSEQLLGKQGQIVLDTRGLGKGSYMVYCTSGDRTLLVSQLIVQ